MEKPEVRIVDSMEELPEEAKKLLMVARFKDSPITIDHYDSVRVDNIIYVRKDCKVLNDIIRIVRTEYQSLRLAYVLHAIIMDRKIFKNRYGIQER